MSERFCRVGAIELCYETFGDPGDPPLLLVMGLGTQMIAWDDDLCAMLVARGFHVIRFDNRDIGRSTHLAHVPPPTRWQLLRRDRKAATYTLEDMADDALGLLDGLGAAPAHVVGASMGGMIAQAMASRRPDGVASLTSIMSTTGNLWRGQATPRVYPFFARRPARSRVEKVERTVRFFRFVGSPGFERDEATLREVASRSFDRGDGDPAGTTRQLAAIFASGDRTASLARITAPTLVLHGTADRLVRPSGGRATARAIPGARLELIEGWGHDLPRGAWPRLVEAIAANAARAAEAMPEMSAAT